MIQDPDQQQQQRRQQGQEHSSYNIITTSTDSSGNTTNVDMITLSPIDLGSEDEVIQLQKRLRNERQPASPFANINTDASGGTSSGGGGLGLLRENKSNQIMIQQISSDDALKNLSYHSIPHHHHYHHHHHNLNIATNTNNNNNTSNNSSSGVDDDEDEDEKRHHHLIHQLTSTIEDNETRICGFSLARFSRTNRFLICLTGVFGFYLIYAIAHEYLFNDGFQHGFFLTMFQFLIYTVGSGIQRSLSSKETLFKRNAPFSSYLMVAFFSVASMGLSNQALRYLSYPAVVIFKSCKLLAVMVSGVFITGRRYSVSDYIAACLLVSGLILLSQSNASADALTPSKLSFHPTGVLYMSLALLADSVVGNLQDMTLSKYNATTSELIFFSHLVGLGYLLMVCTAMNQLVPSVSYFMDKPSAFFVMVLFSTLGFIGSNFFFAMMKEFGVLVSVTTTSCRKVVTLLLSFVLFLKPFGISFLASAALVFAGVGMNIYSKNREAVRMYMQSLGQKLRLFKHQDGINLGRRKRLDAFSSHDI